MLTAQRIELKLRRCQQITNGRWGVGRSFHLTLNWLSQKKQVHSGTEFLFFIGYCKLQEAVRFFFFSMTVRIVSEKWATSATGETIYGNLSRHWKGGFCIGRISVAALPSKILDLMRNTCCEKAASREALQQCALDWRNSQLISNICMTQ